MIVNMCYLSNTCYNTAKMRGIGGSVTWQIYG